jgi:lysophospholipase L1-like esterase
MAALMVAVAVAPAGPGVIPVHRIVCLGDSITSGITHTRRDLSGAEQDSLGGWPGRLERVLDGVRVINRGIGGATTTLWLADSTTGPTAALWRLHHTLWPDATTAPVRDGDDSLALAVLHEDRPDLVVILLGVNDLANPDGNESPSAVVDAAASRLDQLRREALSVTPNVLVATVLPNHREPAELHERLNERIRETYPDYLPFGERFAAADWERLLADAVHPNERGYALLAKIAADELVARGLVRMRTRG